MVMKPCDTRPILAEGKQWVGVSFLRTMIWCLVNTVNRSAYLLGHQLGASDTTITKSWSGKTVWTVMKSGMNPSLKSWKKFPVYPPALNTRAGTLCGTLHGGLCGPEVSVRFLMRGIMNFSNFRG